MKRLTQIFQALLGVVALIFTAIIAFGRLVWRTIRKGWKSCSKVWRYILGALLLLVLSAKVYREIDYKWGRGYWNDKCLSSRVEARGFRNDTFRLYNHELECYTTPRLSWVSTASPADSLAVYALNGKRGYVNVNTGSIVIDAEANDYIKAWVFSEGLAAVMKDGKVGFIDANNEVVIPFDFDYSDECRMWDFGYLFHNGRCIMTNKDGDLGLIDKAGNWVLEPSYDEIWVPIKGGYRVVVDDGKYGVLDASLSLVYQPVYDHISSLSDASGFILIKDGRMWREDLEGRVVCPFMYDESYILSYPLEREGEFMDVVYKFSDYSCYNVGGESGIMNRFTGEPLTPAIYDVVEMISPDIFEVYLPNSSGYYLIDTKGRMVHR